VSLFSGRDGSYLRGLSGGALVNESEVNSLVILGNELLVHTHSRWKGWPHVEDSFHALSLDGKVGRLIASNPVSWSSKWCVVGDCDGDDFRELVVRPEGQRVKRLQIISGRTGEMLGETEPVPTIEGKEPWILGYAVVNAGDLDGDGRAEVAVPLGGHPEHSAEQDFALCVLTIGPRAR
jgi:hypothetical protein